jgi:TonB family protein
MPYNQRRCLGVGKENPNAMMITNTPEQKPSFRMLLGLTIALSASLCALEHGRPLDGNVEKVSREDPVWIEEDPIPITKALPKPPPKVNEGVSPQVVTAGFIPTFQILPKSTDPSELPDIDLSWMDEIVTVETADGPTIDPLDFPDVYPEFPGGDSGLAKFLKDNLHYPDYAKDHRIQGKVFIKFVVNAKGEIDERSFEILGSPHIVLSDEVIRLIKKMPNWKPGQQGPRKVPVNMKLPVNFTLR